MRNISTKIISLEDRLDRRKQCALEVTRLSDTAKWRFFNAKKTPEEGLIGCALSHAMALSDFLFESSDEYVMILEDDFEVIDENFVPNELPKLSTFAGWDVFLLGHNLAVPIEPTPFQQVFRVINSQTTSGYIARRKFVPELVKIFFRSAELLRVNQLLSQPNQTHARRIYALDILWKDLQISHKFLAKFPSVIRQRASFSDIEKRMVDYKV